MKFALSLLFLFALSIHPYCQVSEYTPSPENLWISNKTATYQLLKYVNQSEELGLLKQDYHPQFISSILTGQIFLRNAGDSSIADSTIHAAAMHFFTDAVTGRPPAFSYNGLNYNSSCLDLRTLIRSSILQNNFHLLLNRIESRTSSYQAFKRQLTQLRKQLTDTSSKPRNTTPSVSVLKNRIAAIQHSLNTLRWMNCLLKQNEFTVVVNIPSATLMVYQRDSILMHTKVIVGKPSSRTPVIASLIDAVTLYPYWMVPKNIATKEMLPLIKRNIAYLDNNNLQVLDQQGRRVNPYHIDWHSLSSIYFPYTLRQSSGCDNSLGIIKFNMYNPFNSYLHDTPLKSLFISGKRFYSHGCIRVQHALKVAALLLAENRAAVDTLDENVCPPGKQPTLVPLSSKVPVLVLYHTSWYDDKLLIRWYDDVYWKNKKTR